MRKMMLTKIKIIHNENTKYVILAKLTKKENKANQLKRYSKNKLFHTRHNYYYNNIRLIIQKKVRCYGKKKYEYTNSHG